MICKLFVFAGLLAVARAGVVSGGLVGPATAAVAVAQPTAVLRTESYDPNPQYSFSYSVADGLTGDNKAQEETRNGDVVQGSYSLIEPDGSRRIVSYAADPINGFNAVVQKDPSVTVTRTAVNAAVATASPILRPAAQIVRPAAVVAPSAQLVAARQPLLASGHGPIIRPSAVYGSPYLRQAGAVVAAPSVASSNLISATNGGFIEGVPFGLGVGLGLRAGSLYGAQPLLTTGYGYGAGGLVKVH
ncbi:cuticle protein 19.8-like [Orussus abietinus]|uniref:cuticle protein 19.8-like n=1 Tax=Orussus abietinus TaxID=222816 RepID=UPI000C715E5B|nr:cuticle protein 19.8-like [Orussus abietinus]